jgi:hypothetical protein
MATYASLAHTFSIKVVTLATDRRLCSHTTEVKYLLRHSGIIFIFVRSEVLTAVIMKSTYLPGCDAVWSDRSLQTFRRNLMLPSSPSNSKSSKEQTLYLPGLFFNPEDGGSAFLRNVNKLLSDYTVSRPGR